MDTTWGGQNWYLRGEIKERLTYDTYHIMPKLEKEGVPYKWGTYPGVWISVPSKITLSEGSHFYPLDYILDIGDIYGTDFVVSSSVDIIENDVNTEVSGSYKVVYEVSNKDGNKARAEMNVEIVDGKKMSVNELEKLSGNLREQEVSLYLNGRESFFYDGLFGSENTYIEYNIEGKNAKYFEANVGINKNVRDNQNYGHYGKVQFEVYADSNLIYKSSVLGWKDNYENIVVEIPEGTRTIKLVNTPKGAGNNHGAWGDAKIVTVKSEFDKEIDSLYELLEFSEHIVDKSYVLVDTHVEQRFNNFIYAKDYVKESLNSNDLTIEDIKNLKVFLQYSIEELGQTYKPGNLPIVK